jgi:hypothetical protein
MSWTNTLTTATELHNISDELNMVQPVLSILWSISHFAVGELLVFQIFVSTATEIVIKTCINYATIIVQTFYKLHIYGKPLHSDTEVRQVYTNFPKICKPPKKPMCQKGDMKQFHTENSQILGDMVQNLATSAPWCLRFLHHWVWLHHAHINTAGTHLTSAIIFGSTVTKKVPIFGISNVMSTMTNTSTHCAHTNTIYHFASMAMVPVLVHELPLCYCESTKFVTETVLILKLKTIWQFRLMQEWWYMQC